MVQRSDSHGMYLTLYPAIDSHSGAVGDYSVQPYRARNSPASSPIAGTPPGIRKFVRANRTAPSFKASWAEEMFAEATISSLNRMCSEFFRD